MESKRKIEFLILGMLLTLILIFILGGLPLDLKKDENSDSSFKLYERHSKLFLEKGAYYFEENSKFSSYENGFYKEEILKNSFSRFKNQIFIEDEFSFERRLKL